MDHSVSAQTPLILVVEDEDLVRRLTCRMLEAAGYQVREAADGLQALEVLGEPEPMSLVVSDIRMPHMDGWALSVWLAAHQPDMPILLMSGYDDDPAHPAPELPRLDKPFNAIQLTEAVRRLLRERDARVRRTGAGG